MSRIRIGIIGAGGRGIHSFGYMFTRMFSDRAEIAAIGEPNRARAEAGLAYLGIHADIHTDAHDVFGRKDVDAVVITTPDYLHEEQCVAAFEAGKHVLVDKPMAITGNGCLRVLEASKRAGKILYMGFNLRHDCVVNRLKQLVAAGTFGEIFSVHAIEHYNGGRTYMARWNRLRKYSGGLWIHKGSHDFDVINWLMGKARPVRVSCFASVFCLKPEGLPFKLREGVEVGPTCSVCKYRSECPDRYAAADVVQHLKPEERSAGLSMWGEKAAQVDGYHKDLCIYLSDKDTHDQGIAIVEYDNGATAQHSEYFATSINNREYLLVGTRGGAWADLHSNSIEVYPRWSRDRISYSVHRDPGGHGGADPIMCSEFLDCVQSGRKPTASGADGAWSVAIGQAAEISRLEHRTVKISEVLDADSPLLRE